MINSTPMGDFENPPLFYYKKGEIMINTILDYFFEPIICGLLLSSPIILDIINSKFNEYWEQQKKLDYLSKEANIHIKAYQTKKMVEYYKTVNQGVVSLPAFIEAKKALENKKYEMH